MLTNHKDDHAFNSWTSSTLELQLKNVDINIVKKILVPHTAVKNAIDRIERCYITSKDALEPICLLVIGESRTGKSRVFEYIESKYPKKRFDDGLIVPVLKVSTPSKPTVKGLAENMLDKLGDPTPSKGTETNMTTRLIKLLKAAQVRLVIVDEFQQFYDQQSNQVMHHVADWLKNVIDQSKVALIVGGLPSSQIIINQNEQLAGRFLGQIKMPRFDWMIEESRVEFIAILEAFQELLTDYQLPDLGSDEMAFRFYCATGGLIGYLVKILHEVVINAIFNQEKTIDLKALKIAYLASVYFDNSIELPPAFDAGFTTQVNDELLNKVRSIGVKTPEIHIPKKSRKHKDILHTSAIFRT